MLKKKIPVLISLLVLFAAIYIKYADYEIIRGMRLKVFDTFQNLYPREYTNQPVRILDIDDDSLERLGQWPWPRNLMAKIVDRLGQAGAAAIAMDIVFAEPDRTSPQHILSVWNQQEKLGYLLKGLKDHDDMFAESVANAPVIMGFALNHDKNDKFPEPKAGFSYAGDDPVSALPAYEGAVVTLPALEKAASGNGAISSTPDEDGILRRVPTVFSLNGKFVPSLFSESLRVAQGSSSYLLKSVGASDELSVGGLAGVTAVKNGMFEIPTDSAGTMWVYYTREAPERYIPVWKLLEDDFDTSQIEGNIIFIGTSAAGLKDIRATPMNATTSGVEVHVQALEQIFEQYAKVAQYAEEGKEYAPQFLRRPDIMRGVEILLMFFVGLVLIFVMEKLSALWGAGFMLLALGMANAGSLYAFWEYRILVEPVTPSLAILFVYLSSSLMHYMATEKEKNQVRHAFSHYMSPALVEQLAANPDKLKLGGENKELTILFCDIRGFTTISESFNDAHALTTFINRFLTPMTGIILDHVGTIDKYIGDCIMAFWNAPLDDADHARHGCISALRMMAEVEVLNKIQEQDAKENNRRFVPIHIGIGLNTGICCVGNMGSDQRFDYSVLGDDVNLASRLEGQSKYYGVDIVIGENTQRQVADMATLELDMIKVKGKNKPVRIFTLLGEENLATEAGFISLKESFSSMMEAYRSGQWNEATKALVQCKELHGTMATLPLAGLIELYEERIASFIANPPSNDWDGVFVATSK